MIRICACVFALLAAVSPALAQNAVTVYGGFRSSSNLTDAVSGRSVTFDDTASYAVALDFGIDRNRHWQLFYGHQRTYLKSGAYPAATNNLPLAIDYLQLGGTNFFDSVDRGGYVLGGFGMTIFRPDRAGMDSEMRPSINLGGGYLVPFGKTFGLRFEARGYATLLNNSGSMLCSGGCTVSIKGKAFTQAEALAGLSVRF